MTALVVSCGFGFLVLGVFRAKGTFLGSTSRTVRPGVYLVVGVIALAIALFAATRRGRELIGRELERRQGSGQPDPRGSVGDRARAKAADVKTRAAEAMQRGSVWVSIVVGVLLGAPTPFRVAAIGKMVRNGYALPSQLLLILGFSLITYLVVEVPIVSYAVQPDATAARVQSFSTWLGTHKIEAAAAVAAIVGGVFIVKGLTA